MAVKFLPTKKTDFLGRPFSFVQTAHFRPESNMQGQKNISEFIKKCIYFLDRISTEYKNGLWIVVHDLGWQ